MMGGNAQQSLGALLQILQDSLVQKLDILTKIEAMSRIQGEMVLRPDVTLEEIDANMEQKSSLIEQLTRLDTGFETLYENIRKELLEQKDAYKTEIARIQELISEVMGKSASIEVQEARNKLAIEDLLRKQKKELQHKKNASSVARNYYKAANKLNYVNSQFLDQKK